MTFIASISDNELLTALVPEVASLAPECPSQIMEDAIKRAMREFFSKSRCWRQRGVTLATTEAGVTSYTFNPPANAELLQIHAAWDGEDEIDPELPGEDDDSYPNETSTTFRVAVSADGSEIEIRPAPTDADTVIKGTVSYTLADNADSFPAWVFREYRSELAYGAASRLVAQPAKPWSNPGLYKAFRDEFEKAISEASNVAGPVRRRPLRVTPW